MTPTSDYAFVFPRSFDESKHIAEPMLAIIANTYGVQCEVLRPEQITGPIFDLDK